MNNVDNIIKDLINTINTAYNSPVAMVAENIKLKKIRTGIFEIDYKLNGGIPRGRWVIAVGNESTFKSTFSYIVAGKAQRICGNCMEGHITEKNFKEVSVILNNKSNEYVEYKNGVYYSKIYLADSQKRALYIPGEKIYHTKSFKAFKYELECSECMNPDYSIALIADSEHNYTKQWAVQCNIVHGRVILTLPEYSEQAGEITREVLSTGRCSVIVVDSVPALAPKIENTVSFEDQQMAIQARIWNKIVRVLTSMLNKAFTYNYVDKNNEKVIRTFRPEPILIIIQQWREKIGAYGDPNTMTAGKGLKFASSLTIEFGISEYDYEDKKTKKLNGIWFSFLLKKSKIVNTMTNGRFYFDLNNYKIVNDESIINAAVENGLIRQSGAWYIYNDVKYQGKLALINKLKETNELEKLKEILLEKTDDTTTKKTEAEV